MPAVFGPARDETGQNGEDDGENGQKFAVPSAISSVHYKRFDIERNKNKNVYSFNVIRLTKILLSKLKPHTRKHAKQKLNQSQRYETKKNANFSPHAIWVLVVITGCLCRYTKHSCAKPDFFGPDHFPMLRVNKFHAKHWTHKTLRCTGYGEKGIKCHTKLVREKLMDERMRARAHVRPMPGHKSSVTADMVHQRGLVLSRQDVVQVTEVDHGGVADAAVSHC